MTLVAGRMQSLHSLERSLYSEDTNMQGILKSGPTRRANKSVKTEASRCNIGRQADNIQRNDDGKRLVRFCENEESEKQYRNEKTPNKTDCQDVIMFGSNLYFVNNPDPNSAVRKLFPNSKLTPINPFINRGVPKDSNLNHSFGVKPFENNKNIFNKSTSTQPVWTDDGNGRNDTKRIIDRNVLRRSLLKVPPETKPKPRKTNEPTPLIERIKQLTCDSEHIRGGNSPAKEPTKFSSTFEEYHEHLSDSTKVLKNPQQKNTNHMEEQLSDLPKLAKKELSLIRYNQNMSQTRPQLAIENKPSFMKSNSTDEARRTFLSNLSKDNELEPGDRTSIATNSTTADTVYSLSDIEEALTEEETEIKEAFAHEIKQDELELFVQQDAGRTERLRQRYSSTPKPENLIPLVFPSTNLPVKHSAVNAVHFTNNCNNRKDKPKFGSTIEILQQLQQQIDTPYQLEGRRTACSNYSDSSIPISDRLFGDESSDGYEPISPKLNVHRTCSLDSKNYEEIDNFYSSLSVPRTKSHEHPRLAHLESDSYIYPPNSTKYPGSLVGNCQPIEQHIYASSPDLQGYHHTLLPDRFSTYNDHPFNSRQLHPVLQKQYCRYPVNSPPKPAEEGKVLTPPNRMHTYMNVPINAPCYLAPPPYSQTNQYINPPTPPEIYQYESPHSNIYQNVPFQPNSHNMMMIRRFCTEKERGVPEGASSTHDPKEIYQISPKDFYFSSNTATIPKQSSSPHHYCVDV